MIHCRRSDGIDIGRPRVIYIAKDMDEYIKIKNEYYEGTLEAFIFSIALLIAIIFITVKIIARG